MPGNAKSGRYPKLLWAEKSRIIALSARGMSDRDLAREVGRSLGTVQLVIRQAGGVASKINWDPSTARLSAQDREDIRRGLIAGDSFRTIAAGAVDRVAGSDANSGRKADALRAGHLQRHTSCA